MCGIDERILGRDLTDLIGQNSCSREVLMEIDVQNIIDEASHGNTVVTHIQMVPRRRKKRIIDQQMNKGQGALKSYMLIT